MDAVARPHALIVNTWIRAMRALPIAAMLSLILCSSVGAQTNVPKRPSLAAGADTCDAAAYLDEGMRVLERDPWRAADDFYWAARIDPTSADALLARRVALLMTDAPRLAAYMNRNRRALENKTVRQIDSLQYRALTMNPFVYRGLEKNLFFAYMRNEYEQDARMAGEQLDVALLSIWIEKALRTASPSMRAWAAYGSREFGGALDAYAAAIKHDKENSYLHAQRGRTFFLVGSFDSAMAETRQALAMMRERDEKKLVYVYESKALYEHSIGLLLEARGDLAGARDAYGRALQEDLSYYPAHVRTAALALRTGDTASAVAAMQLAAQIRPDDPAVLVSYGELLVAMGRPADAELPLRHAREVNPVYADPHFLLARALEAQGKAAAAAAEYRAFLDRAARGHRRRGQAEARVRALAPAAQENR